jgi:hypothetical protein
MQGARRFRGNDAKSDLRSTQPIEIIAFISGQTLRAFADRIVGGYYVVGRQYTPVAKYAKRKLEEKHRRLSLVRKDDGTIGYFDQCPQAKTLAGD